MEAMTLGMLREITSEIVGEPGATQLACGDVLQLVAARCGQGGGPRFYGALLGPTPWAPSALFPPSASLPSPSDPHRPPRPSRSFFKLFDQRFSRS